MADERHGWPVTACGAADVDGRFVSECEAMCWKHVIEGAGFVIGASLLSCRADW